ncbi:hypothetical protein BASA81_002855 [Batrachochytrium salamandrivorans]|nr:hypothetical protein BASA81_002855 [Batrachochytrium salamandrivorans]
MDYDDLHVRQGNALGSKKQLVSCAGYMVLYYRAWCISSTKRSWQKYISIFMTVGHAACLIIDADHSLTATYDIPNVGCVSYPGWPRSVLGIFSTINDIFQVVLFCSPLLRAVHNSTEVRRDTTAYRRMIMKATVCLVICVVMNITYAILVATNFQIISLLFSDIALTFQVLSACEIQFNSHRETDKASLGGILGYRSPMIRQKDMPMQSSPIVSAGGGVYTSESAASSTHIGEHSPVHVLISH